MASLLIRVQFCAEYILQQSKCNKIAHGSIHKYTRTQSREYVWENERRFLLIISASATFLASFMLTLNCVIKCKQSKFSHRAPFFERTQRMHIPNGELHNNENRILIKQFDCFSECVKSKQISNTNFYSRKSLNLYLDKTALYQRNFTVLCKLHFDFIWHYNVLMLCLFNVHGILEIILN